MSFRRFAAARTLALALLTSAGLAACETIESTLQPIPAPALTTLTVSLSPTSITTGQTSTATAAGLDQINSVFVISGVAWSTGNAAIATVDAATGVVTGRAAGTTTVIATTGGKTAQASITVTAPPAIRINEVESNGGTPGDWIELYNPTTAAVSIAGWALKDNDNTRTFQFPAGTTIPAGGYLVAEEAAFGYGLGAADSARLYNQFGAPVDVYGWETHATSSYGRCPNGTGPFVTMSSVTKGAINDCRPQVKINEVESNGGTPGDWIELYNVGTTTVNLSGFIIKDNDNARTTALPAGTTIAPGAFFIIEEAVLGFGLGAADAARIYDANGALLDSYEWTAHAAITYGRCPDGTGAFAATTVSTKGAANVCVGGPPPASPWPGSDDVRAVDGTAVFGGNMSGLTYERASGGQPNILWAAKNGPGSIYRLIFSGGIWTPDPANNWGAGKALRYTDSTGEADAEGITFAGTGSAAGLYIASERNNGANSVSRNSVLRYDPSQPGTVLRATNEWNLTSDLPVVGANLGVEAITWIPDSMLVANQFFDESKGRAYAPADYADHGTGLFFVGVEANGNIYAYALNHVTNGFTRIATITTGFPGVMGMEYDRETGYLWAICDDGCGNTTGILEIDVAAASPTRGRFLAPRRYARPPSMPNINNEGFALAPNAECVAGRKPVFWADDSETGGRSIRQASVPCGTVAPSMPALRAVRQSRR